MTEKLYYCDSYNFSFEAVVVDIVAENGIAVVLDRTYFFPEGGGQKSDIGNIGNAYVYDVQEVNGVIYHYIKDSADIMCGESYSCKVDKNTRFSRMQAHTGEHILSGLAHKYFGVENVGFHMDENHLMTVDFNMSLTADQVAFLEIETNKCIFDNLPVSAVFYSAEEAAVLDYRSKIAISDNIRIVSIGDIDKCACCAPHLNSTSQVGLLKILSFISHRGGVRLTLICGMAAFNDYVSKHKQILNISSMICSPHNETDSGVEQLICQNKEIKRSVAEQKDRLFRYIYDNTAAESFIVRFFSDFAADELRLLSNKLQEKAEYGVFIFSGNDSDGYSYCINSGRIQLREFLLEMKEVLNATGGGKGSILQGKILANKQNILDFVNEKRKCYENEKKETP